MSDDRATRPEIVVFAGPNGSGKSTITGPEWIKGPYINADDIQREEQISNLEAAQKADAVRMELMEQGKTFSFETVLSTERKLDFLRQAKDKGYFIRGYFILTCDPMLNVARVQARVCNGGHDVPQERIVSRYEKSLANIPAFLRVCDICHIYDNTIRPFRICRKHKRSIKLFENEFWSNEEIQALLFS